MTRRPALLLAAVVVTACTAAYAGWWLLVDQTSRLESLAHAGHTERNVPTDGATIAQSFAVPEGGSDAACVFVVNRADGERSLLVQLHSEREGQPAHVLSRAIRSVVPGRRECMDIPISIQQSRHASVLWVSLRAISAEATAGLRVLVADANTLPHGRLLIDGRERWGALGLTVSAPSSTRWHSAWPVGLYRPSRRHHVLWLVCIAVAVAASGLLLAARHLAVTPASAAAAIVGVPLVVGALHVLSEWSPRAVDLTYSGTGRALLNELGDAEFLTTWPSLADAFALVVSDIRPVRDRALVALPDSSVGWRIGVAGPTSLDTAVALRQEAWTRPGDGATFTISVTTGDRTDVLWKEHVDPFADAAARRWQDVTVRLDRYVGQNVTLTLTTDAGPNGNAVMDAAMWREPILRPSVVR